MSLESLIKHAARGADFRLASEAWGLCIASEVRPDLTWAWTNPAVRALYRALGVGFPRDLPAVGEAIEVRDEAGVLLPPEGMPPFAAILRGEIEPRRTISASAGGEPIWIDTCAVPVIRGGRLSGALWLSWALGPDGPVPVEEIARPGPPRDRRGLRLVHG